MLFKVSASVLFYIIYIRVNFKQAKGFLKLINNSSRENKENHYRDRGLDM